MPQTPYQYARLCRPEARKDSRPWGPGTHTSLCVAGQLCDIQGGLYSSHPATATFPVAVTTEAASGRKVMFGLTGGMGQAPIGGGTQGQKHGWVTLCLPLGSREVKAGSELVSISPDPSNSGFQSLGWCYPCSGWVFSPQLNRFGNSLIDTTRGVFTGSFFISQVISGEKLI